MDIKAAKKEIIDRIEKLSGAQTPYNVFYDWVETSALAIASATCMNSKVKEGFEKRYMETIKKDARYEKEFPILFGILTMMYEDEVFDVLGDVFMSSKFGNSITGQFFTPYHLSRLCAEMAAEQTIADCKDGLFMNEPSCGSGGMIIATADVLKKRGINYQKMMRVVAQDLDWRCVYMTFISLSLLGIDAIVVQGDTLREPFVPGKGDERHILRTPRNAGMLI